MTRATFAEQLLAAADSLDGMSHAETQVLLRRAALRLRNELQDRGTVILDEDVTEAIDALAEREGFSRTQVVNTALRDWLVGHGEMRADELEEDSKVDGSA